MITKSKILKSSVIILSLILFSCGTQKKIETLKPEPSSTSSIVYSTKTSYVGMPVEIKIKDIQTVLNQNLKGIIYKDSILNDDNIEMKIWKQNDIKLSYANGKIKSELPLKIWIKYKYGTEFMGLNDTREFNLNGTITLLSNVTLSNWKLNMNSTIDKTEWNESPTINIAGKSVAITYAVNPTLSYFKKDIAAKIDKAINENCDFKPQVIDALKQITEPFQANAQFDTWVSIKPLEIYSTDAQLLTDKVLLNLGLKCSIQTLIGDKPKNNINWDKVAVTRVTKIQNSFTGNIAAVSSYASASRVITNNFKGQTFGEGNKKIMVNQVEIWQKNNNLIIALNMNGTINGTIYLTGTPKYKAQTQEIYFENLDYVLDTKNVLHKSGSWLLNGMILRKMQENCKYKITDDIENGKKIAATYLTNYSPMSGVFINGKLENLEFEKFELTPNAIISFIKANGNVNVKINGLQ